MNTSRLTHLLYRCVGCKRLLTRLEIVAEWERLERTKEPCKGICPCGGSRISPANAKLWEELFIPRIWKLWWVEIAKPALIKAGVWLR